MTHHTPSHVQECGPTCTMHGRLTLGEGDGPIVFLNANGIDPQQTPRNAEVIVNEGPGTLTIEQHDRDSDGKLINHGSHVARHWMHVPLLAHPNDYGIR